MFSMKKKEIDLTRILEIKLAKHDQITSGPPFRLLTTRGMMKNAGSGCDPESEGAG